MRRNSAVGGNDDEESAIFGYFVFHENIDGELVAKKEMSIVDVEEKFVEAIVIGRRGEWIEWYSLKQFQEMNPGIRI